MRRRTDQPTTVWNAQVNTALIEEIEARIPVRGARVWLITEGLSRFLAEVRHSPSAQNIAHDDIQAMLHLEQKETHLSSINIRIPTPLYAEFNEIFPEWGGATWFIRRLLRAFNEQLTKQNLRLSSLIDSSIEQLYRKY